MFHFSNLPFFVLSCFRFLFLFRIESSPFEIDCKFGRSDGDAKTKGGAEARWGSKAEMLETNTSAND